MPRKGPAKKRTTLPDSLYNSKMVAQFINKTMRRGKKSLAESIVYRSLDIIKDKTKKDPLDVFERAMKNVRPAMEVKPRRVGGATYQVPVEVKLDRQVSLAMRWLISFAKKRSGKSMAEKLSAELMDAATNKGATIKKKEDTYKMAEANKAFAHYRW
ncbi:MAG: 30S ribosomal protein S7 [Armatimonadetes bacterium CG07_land_8_20_14_0_80_40_9]|nr:MAG: 30S ribosomal protein S7 [Armatimonadetes bacterium CG07_land_8_20_14_0_80_40_9]